MEFRMSNVDWTPSFPSPGLGMVAGGRERPPCYDYKYTMSEINEKVYEKAIKLLSIRFHTTGELHRKLKTRGFKDGDILPVLRRLEESDFLNDKRFAEIFVENLKRYKDFGYYGIKVKLAQRQIPEDIAADALKEFFTLEEEMAVAQRLLKKLLKQKKTAYEQLSAAFARRGFRGEAVRKALTILR